MCSRRETRSSMMAWEFLNEEILWLHFIVTPLLAYSTLNWLCVQLRLFRFVKSRKIRVSPYKNSLIHTRTLHLCVRAREVLVILSKTVQRNSILFFSFYASFYLSKPSAVRVPIMLELYWIYRFCTRIVRIFYGFAFGFLLI